MDKKVAIQGEEASFHDIAAMKFFGPDIKRVCCKTFKDTFAAVKSGKATHAVCAIENSLYGSINETYDLLAKNDFAIIGEIYLRVKQCLIVLPGTKLKDIKEVCSHPVALAQCEEYLDKALPSAERLEFHDTAASVEKVKGQQEKKVAAIASSEAAELYGMEILAEEIETNKQNYTRFIVLESPKEVIPGRNKTSLIIKTPHSPGALYRALGAFAEHSINLSKLQSRPIVGDAWHYIFYVDVDAGSNDSALTKALAELDKQGCEIKLLGSYVAWPKP
jgi:prephenate dehydratase